MSTRTWCDTCRGDGEKGDTLFKCSKCPRRFHATCAGLHGPPDKGHSWKCSHCTATTKAGKTGGSQKTRKKRVADVRRMHKELRARSATFFSNEREKLAPFVEVDKLNRIAAGNFDDDSNGGNWTELRIGSSPSFVNAELRDYQQVGVDWLLARYGQGAGGILADEMGLGKTIQTLAFLAKLKDAGLPGPHLVITPLAVLQNWCNEIKRFTPGMSHIKIHGSLNERDRLLSDDAIVNGEYDIYLTTYDTLLSEEAFFTEAFLFHTVVIDEGHRLKNANCKLCEGLARISSPFRLLLTGTPLQNNMNELWALLQYILPTALDKTAADGTSALSMAETDDGGLDRVLISKARALLEACMIRRVKSEATTELKPKVEYVLKTPLTGLQRKWYRSFLKEEGSQASGLLTANQLMNKVLQLGKVVNHPKTLALTFDREREAAAAKARQAEGSEFVKLDINLSRPKTADAVAMEAELRSLSRETLIMASGKMALLDRLLLRKKQEGSRVLIFAQFTMTLDVLEEYIKYRFGGQGSAFFRLDGGTNRIQREMDMRAFNSPGSEVFCYLISTRAGGQGINLATADTVVLYDTCWNPQVDLQAQDRAHRIGQKKQVRVYRLIAEYTVEEKVLARARQKMLLDALVMKKQGEGDAMADSLLNVDDEGEAEMSKLSVNELWSILSQGVDKVFDPTVDDAPDLSIADYDEIISNATPATWDDGKSSDDRLNVRSCDSLSVEDCKRSTLGGTIFDKRSENDVTFSKSNAMALLSSDVGGAPSFDGFCKEVEVVDLSMTPPKPVDTTISGRRPKRTIKAPKKYSPVITKGPSKKKRRVQHDSSCFSCRRHGTLTKFEKTKAGSFTVASSASELFPCIACPRAFHVGCVEKSSRPKNTKSWHCPWHACVSCSRKSSNAGGTLFHCTSCPLTYCFDCCPDKFIDRGQSTSEEARALTNDLERRGVASLKSYMFFTCDSCKTIGPGPFRVTVDRGPSPTGVASFPGFFMPFGMPWMPSEEG